MESVLCHMEVLPFVFHVVIFFQKAFVFVLSNMQVFGASHPPCHSSSAVLHFKMISGSMTLSDNVCPQACNFTSNLFLSPMVTRAQLGLSALTSVILLT